MVLSSHGGGGWNAPAAPAPINQFPLSVHASGRYLVDASGKPFLIHGDTGWSAVGMLTDAQIDQYVDNRSAKGFNLILIQAPVLEYTTDGSAGEENIDGVAPFTTMSPHYDWVLNNTYWTRVDRLVNRCKAAGIAVIINPAYMGYNGASGIDGCMAEITNASTGTLQTYGATLATRYAQGNVIWCMGGDWPGDTTERAKQWNIVTGMRTVRTTDLITAHPNSDLEAYTYWNGYMGWNLNATYCYETNSHYAYAEAANAYGRSGPLPFIFFEGKYENSTSATLAMLRHQSYGTLLAGGCGQIYGNYPVWNFESPQWNEGSAGTWQSNLDSTGATEQTYVLRLFAAFEWWKLVPKTDTSLVSSSLSSGASRVVPALASDGTFALIYVPSSQSVTVVMTNFASSSVRVRLYDPTNGTFSTVGTYANTGSQSIATGGERVIVLDAA
jgi:hypothetical protein